MPEITCVAGDHGHHRLPVPLLGDERRRRRETHGGHQGQLPGSARGELLVEAEDLLGVVGGPGDQSADDGRAHFVESEGELGDHPEVAAAPAQRPEQLGLVLPTGVAQSGRRR